MEIYRLTAHEVLQSRGRGQQTGDGPPDEIRNSFDNTREFWRNRYDSIDSLRHRRIRRFKMDASGFHARFQNVTGSA
jgi:hypothetical protein